MNTYQSELMKSLKTAFPNKEVITFTECARWMGLTRGDTLKNTPDFPRIRVGKREVVPIRTLAIYMAGGK